MIEMGTERAATGGIGGQSSPEKEGGRRTHDVQRTSLPGKPLVSIITVVFNNGSTIEDTIRSIESQTYRNVEHIVIDGGSTDQTLDVIQRHQHKIAQFISEPDRGIFDAMNKGLLLATGDVVALLNADDIYADAGVLQRMADVFADPAVEVCYADLVYVDPQDMDKPVRYWKSSAFRPGLFGRGWVPAHPTFFARRSAYQQYGGYDESLGLAADFELMLRLLERYRLKSVYIPQVSVKMRLGGASNRSIRNIVRQNIDIMRACRKNHVPVSLLFFFAKPWAKLSQYVMRPTGS